MTVLFPFLAMLLTQVPGDFGRPNPNAPRELTQFAFLIGKWRCESRVKGKDGTTATYRAERTGRYILDGYVIADEFRQFGAGGELMQLGVNYRSYDRVNRAWILKWHDAIASTWLDMGQEDLGGVQVTDTSVSYLHRVPPGQVGRLFPPHALFRNTFLGYFQRSFHLDGGDLAGCRKDVGAGAGD